MEGTRSSGHRAPCGGRLPRTLKDLANSIRFRVGVHHGRSEVRPAVRGGGARPHRGVGTLVVASLLAGIVGSSCSSAAGGKANSKSTLVLADFVAFSGPDASFGPEGDAGCLPAVKLINAAGGVLGHHLACLPFDTKGDPVDAVPLARQLLSADPNVVAILGESGDEASATVPIFNAAQLTIDASTGQPAFDHTTDKYFWRNVPADDAQGYAMAAAVKKLGYTRVATVFGESTSASGSQPTAIRGLQELGITIVANQTLALDQLSYRSEVEQLIAAKPQAIVTETDPQTAATYLAELTQLGTLPAIIVDAAGVQPPYVKAVGGAIGQTAMASKTSIILAYAPTNAPAYKVFTQALFTTKAVGNASLWSGDLYSAANYDMVNVIALAMIEAHSTSSTVYNDYILKVTAPSPGAVIVGTFAAGVAALRGGKKIEYVGATGPILFNKYHSSQNEYSIQRYKGNGEIVEQVIPASSVDALAK